MEPMAVASCLTGKESIEYHYKMLTIIAEEDVITALVLERTENNPDAEPFLASGIHFGQGVGQVIARFGDGYKLTDEQSLIYSDGLTKIIFYAPRESVERITIRY